MMAKLSAAYDKSSDVLYLSIGKPVPAEGDGLPRGIELDFSIANGKPCGLTVIGFQRNGWPKSIPELASIAGSHLHVSPETAQGTIIEATRVLA